MTVGTTTLQEVSDKPLVQLKAKPLVFRNQILV